MLIQDLIDATPAMGNGFGIELRYHICNAAIRAYADGASDVDERAFGFLADAPMSSGARGWFQSMGVVFNR